MKNKKWLGMSNWFWILFVAILILWAVGLFTGFLGGYIHILILVEIILIILWLMQRFKNKK